MIVNIGLDEFRKNFKKDFPDFVLRIREKEDKNELAYYNGIKCFEVKKHKEGIEISLPENTYKCNVSDVVDDLIFDTDLRNRNIQLCEGMKDFFPFKMEKITYEHAQKSDKNKIYDSLDNFKESATKYLTANDKKIKVDVDKVEKCVIFKNLDDDTKIALTDIKDIIRIQYLFIVIVKLSGTKRVMSKIADSYFEISFEKNEKIYQYDDLINTQNTSSFINKVKLAIEHYSGKKELEKKYQHQFMLYGDLADNLFNNKKVTAFEQEYGIINKNRKDEEGKFKNGRVDCVFYSFDNVSKKIEDVYLIELKVNDDVVLGNNGVLTHLDDIKAFCSDKEQLDTLVKRIKYRISVLDSIEKNDINGENIKYHFYTIIGFTKAKTRTIVEGYLNDLKDKEKMKKLYSKLNKYFFECDETCNIINCKTIEDVKPNIDTKFFFEVNDWDPSAKLGTQFEDYFKNE